jgi:hypothetical protein
MKTYQVPEVLGTRRIVLIACAAALAVALTVALLQTALAENNTPPPVPANIAVPAGNELFLVGHATGTQNYICLPSGAGVAYTLFTPQAALYKNKNKQVTTHFFSPNPAEGGTIRATWLDSQDSSMVWARVLPGNASADPAYVAAGAVPWVLLTVVGTQHGPIGDGTLAQTTFIQRLNTTGGVAPSTGCASAADIGAQAYVPYTADYFFYRAAGSK